MTIAATTDDLVALARFLAREAPGGERIALAHVVRTRAAHARQSGEFGDGTFASACRSLGAQAACGASGSVEFLKALSDAALVAGGIVPDPTRGATHFHDHDEEPEWAKRMHATALIGRRMFYRPRV